MFWLCSFLRWSDFLHVSCLGLIPLSLILAKRLIASLQKDLEICLQWILSNLEVRSSVIWGGRGTKDLVVYVKVYRQSLTDVWDQSNLELASTLFVCFSYARNRSLDRDLFCGMSSARLLSAIHILWLHLLGSHLLCPGLVVRVSVWSILAGSGCTC